MAVFIQYPTFKMLYFLQRDPKEKARGREDLVREREIVKENTKTYSYLQSQYVYLCRCLGKSDNKTEHAINS